MQILPTQAQYVRAQLALNWWERCRGINSRNFKGYLILALNKRKVSSTIMNHWQDYFTDTRINRGHLFYPSSPTSVLNIINLKKFFNIIGTRPLLFWFIQQSELSFNLFVVFKNKVFYIIKSLGYFFGDDMKFKKEKTLRNGPWSQISKHNSAFSMGISNETKAEKPKALEAKLVALAKATTVSESTAFSTNKTNILDTINTEQALRIASKKIKSGDYLEAQNIYIEILKKFPAHKKARYALKLIQKDNICGPIDPPVEKYQFIITLYNEGKSKEALEHATKSLIAYPRSVVLHAICGATNADLKDLEAAITSYEKAVTISPSYAEAHYNLGNVYNEVANFDAAINSYKNSLKYRNSYYEAYYRLGYTQRIVGELDAAIDNFKIAIELRPDHAEAYNYLGYTQTQKGDFEVAISSLVNATNLRPNYVDAHFNLGKCYLEKLDLQAAIDCYDQVIKIKPDHAVAYLYKGNCKVGQCDLVGAIFNFTEAIKLKPDFTEAITNLANAQKDCGYLSEAILNYNKALEKKPGNADVLFNQSLAYLAQENFQGGWAQYEFRWQSAANHSSSIVSIKPRWIPSAGGTVLLWSEQGIGDLIMFSSMVLETYRLADKLIIQTDERLIPLFKRSFPADIQYYNRAIDTSTIRYDYQIPFGSLAQHFRPSLQSFKEYSGAFLKADLSLSHKLRKELLGERHTKIIGISWRGGTKKDNFQGQREIRLVALANAIKNDGVQLVSLQYGDTAEELRKLAVQYGINVITVPEIDNFSDLDGLSSLIRACDHVVSVDNSTVFMSGALGIETTVLLPRFPNWRWGNNRNKSYWHSSVNMIEEINPTEGPSQLEVLEKNFKMWPMQS